MNENINGQNLPKGYENKMVIVLCLAFGFVMFDRFTLANIWGDIAAELNLNDSHLGVLMGVFAATWAVVGFFGSVLADTKLSRKKLLMMFVLFFSVCSLLTGLAVSFVMLIVVRAVMGCFEGPVMPVSQSFIIPQSSPHRRGFNMGLMQVSAVGLISSLLGPVIQVALAGSIGWRYTFVVTIIPGVIISFLIYKILINPNTGANEADAKASGEKVKREKGATWNALNNRNVILSIVGTLFLLTWYVCMLTFAPQYLSGEKGFTKTEMSYIMAAFGAGAIVWGVTIPKLSDIFGRKPLVLIAAVMGAFASFGLVWAPHNLPLLLVIAFVGWGGTGVCALMQSTIPAESGDPRFVSTIIGTNQLTGELVGATAGASIMGFVSVSAGRETVLYLLGGCMLVCFVISLFYKESAPLVVARKEAAAAQKQ
ncbi:MAG: MFS transporter [Clostridiales Family XIII bacterium]|nr:MFS transporter [Clostridiales Family XIII bacterium]